MDIFQIHTNIIDNFELLINTKIDKILDEYQSQYIYDKDCFNIASEVDDMPLHQYQLLCIIFDTILHIKYSYYLLDSEPLIKEYLDTLKKPVKLSFVNKVSNSSNTKTKKNIEKKYIELARKYINIILPDSILKNTSSKCKNCNSIEFEYTSNSDYICVECGSVIDVIIYTTKYTDNERVKMVTKYVPDRKIHFRECLLKFLGRENKAIPDKLLIDLRKYLSRYSVDDTIYREHILSFIKSTTEYSEYSENISLIYKLYTSKELYNISYKKEEEIINDFGILSDAYDKNYKGVGDEKRSFLNSQYIIYQLFKKHSINCNKKDFIMLKTPNRKIHHDELCQELFYELGWSKFFQPMF
jgi:hypothetical protein